MLLLLPAKAPAEIILLKDGTRVEAENVQEENGLIRFSLPGYEGIFITYSKDIVAGIYKDGELPPEGYAEDPPAEPTAAQQSEPFPTGASQSSKSGPVPAEPDKIPADTVQSPPELKTKSKTAITDGASPATPPAVYSEYSGIEFYNPRRRYKYWTGPEEKHLRFEDAVAVLAERFDRSPEWVIENLGEANDLALVHSNLAERMQNKAQDGAAAPPNTAGLQFYDPRRTFKYWSSPDRHHRTLDEAVEALAKQYNRSPGWVKAHLGLSNDLAKIHRSLTAAAQE